MKRAALYSRSRGAREAAPPADAAPAQPAAPARPSLLRRLATRRNLLLPLAIGGLIVALVFTATSSFKPAPRQITQRDIDRAVLHTLNTKPLPSAAAKAYEAVRRSVVLVRGITPGENGEEDSDDAVGTGVVIGETSVIGNNVKIYQGVTLGALSTRRERAGEKRHPTLEDDVTIYSGATILGGDTVIGRGATVGGNVWVTASVPPGSKIFGRAKE